MTDFFNKLENFLFDLLGLVLPGLILIIMTVAPLLMFDFNNIPEELLNKSRLLATFDLIASHISDLQNLDPKYVIGITILASYILGHSIKVFSIIFYDFGRLIFDNSILKFFKWIGSTISQKIKADKTKPFPKYLKTFVAPIQNTLQKVFTFESDLYFSANESLVKESVKIINEKLSTEYPEDWYSIYKFSGVVNSQEKLKSLSGFFLAKYNLYRSLSFLFIVTFFYFQVFYSATESALTEGVKNMKILIELATILLWFTFHVKFKRYWTLCGNETLISLYYFLNRDLLRNQGTETSDAG